MLRYLYQQLVAWQQSPRRKPLILKGARQVGKTYLLKAFAAQEYANFVYLNFEEDLQLQAFFQEDLKPARILQELGFYFKTTIDPEKTLLIFDEIQECPAALNSLKYFCETCPKYPIVAAGSLLGVTLTQRFPVGKVNFLQLHPLSFFEFLIAMNESELVALLKKDMTSLILPFHERLLKWLKYYLIIGGMPEAVYAYQQRGDLSEVRVIQKEILDTYALDFAKHASPADRMKIAAIWQQIPAQLAKENKKFIFTAIRQSARGREYETALQWLVAAGLIIQSHDLSIPKLPLSGYKNANAFKIYALDVGLLGSMSRLDPQIILNGNQLFEEFKGALTESFAAQMLHINYGDEMYYWTSSTGSAEVDFVIATQQHVYPLEVKAGLSKHKKSLRVFGDKYMGASEEYPVAVLSRTNPQPFERNERFVNYPLYALELFPMPSAP